MITGWPIDKPSIFYLPLLQEWIYLVPNAAGSTAILMGIGLGIVVTSLRYIFGLEKSYLGEMEAREGNKYWIDRFFAKHLVILYYWIMVGYYVLDPLDAYDINMKIEKHAYETYIKYLSYHPEDKRIAEIAEDELEHARELQHAMSMIV